MYMYYHSKHNILCTPTCTCTNIANTIYYVHLHVHVDVGRKRGYPHFYEAQQSWGEVSGVSPSGTFWIFSFSVVGVIVIL